MTTSHDLYNALQSFRQYVEANMPFKETVYFVTVDPSSGSGKAANIGAMCIYTDINKTAVINVFYKAGNGNTDWLTLLGSDVTLNPMFNPTAGLVIKPNLDITENLDVSLINSDGAIISISKPLVIPFQNIIDNDEKGFYEQISVVEDLKFTLTSATTLGVIVDVPQNIYVYVGIDVSDVTDVKIVLKANSRIDTIYPQTVHNLTFATQSDTLLYADLGATSTTTGSYRLHLISIVNIEYDSASTAWTVPNLITPYFPDLDLISDKLLNQPESIGIPLRQQLNELTNPTLLDLQILYNNLAEQTYFELNNVLEYPMPANYSMTAEDFNKYFAVILKPTASGFTYTIPNIPKSKTMVFKNGTNFLVSVAYSSESIILDANESAILNFCGTSVVTNPKIRELTNKPSSGILSLKAQTDGSGDNVIVTARHPNGSDLSANNSVQLNLNKFIQSFNAGTANYQLVKLINNLTLTVPVDANLGLSNTVMYSQHLYIFIYNAANGTQGLAICSGKLPDSKVYNIQQITAFSSSKNTLYADVAVTNASIKFIGYYTFNRVTHALDSINSSASLAQGEVLENISTESPKTSLMPLVNGDTIEDAFKKIYSNEDWIHNFADSMKDIENIKVIVATPEFDGLADYYLNFFETYDSNGYLTKLGKRYCILDYPTIKTVRIEATGAGTLFVADIITASVNLRYYVSGSGGTVDQTLVLSGGKRYYIWVAPLDQWALSDNVTQRMRIISKYPDDASNNDKNYKVINPLTTNLTASVKDFLILSNLTTNDMTINLPNITDLKSKIYMQFPAVSTAYPFTYSIFHSSGVPFYQTIEDAITVNNGGFILEFEYTSISSVNCWFVTLYSNYT